MVNVTGVNLKPQVKYTIQQQRPCREHRRRVIVETEQGLGFGIVAVPSQDKDKDEKSLKNIVRLATREDFTWRKELKSLEIQAHEYCLKCIKDLSLFNEPVQCGKHL